MRVGPSMTKDAVYQRERRARRGGGFHVGPRRRVEGGANGAGADGGGECRWWSRLASDPDDYMRITAGFVICPERTILAELSWLPATPASISSGRPLDGSGVVHGRLMWQVAPGRVDYDYIAAGSRDDCLAALASWAAAAGGEWRPEKLRTPATAEDLRPYARWQRLPLPAGMAVGVPTAAFDDDPPDAPDPSDDDLALDITGLDVDEDDAEPAPEDLADAAAAEAAPIASDMAGDTIPVSGDTVAGPIERDEVPPERSSSMDELSTQGKAVLAALAGHVDKASGIKGAALAKAADIKKSTLTYYVNELRRSGRKVESMRGSGYWLPASAASESPVAAPQQAAALPAGAPFVRVTLRAPGFEGGFDVLQARVSEIIGEFARVALAARLP